MFIVVIFLHVVVLMIIMSVDTRPLVIGSYNCRGFNTRKSSYVADLLSECDILLLQEHRLSDSQLPMLGDIKKGIMYNGISGFDHTKVLSGRPYGGCAILWHSELNLSVLPISVDSRRMCAISLSSDNWKLIVMNVYMPYEDSDRNIDDYMYLLSLIEDVITSNADSHFIVGGDFNVGFQRTGLHTALLDKFCDDAGLVASVKHTNSVVDYTYHFCMDRFNILDHFLLSHFYFTVLLIRFM